MQRTVQLCCRVMTVLAAQQAEQGDTLARGSQPMACELLGEGHIDGVALHRKRRAFHARRRGATRMA
jgi:hypothetical protein